MYPTVSRTEQQFAYQRDAYEDQSLLKSIIWEREPFHITKRTFNSVTFQSFIFVFGGSFDHVT